MKATEDEMSGRCPFGGDQAAEPTLSPLSEAVLRDIEGIAAALDEVHPLSPELWQQGFARSPTPEQEVAKWQHIARTYQHLVTESFQGVKEGHRKAIFRILHLCSTDGQETAHREAVALGMPAPIVHRVFTVFSAS